MKTNIKRILGLVLSFTLVLGTFAGCSESGNQNNQNNQSNQNVQNEQDNQDNQNNQNNQDDQSEPEDQLAAIQKAGKIIVGVEGTYPPFTYHDQETNELIGLDIEIAKAVGEKLGVEVEFVEGAWDALLVGVQSGRFDTVINAVTASDERRQTYDFSTPYFYIPKQVVVRGDYDEIQSEDDLEGKTIATNITNVMIPYFEEHGASVVGIDTSGEAAELLLAGRVDFIGFSPVVLQSYLDQHPESDLKVAFVIPNSSDPVAIPIRKGEDRLREAIDQALAELAEEGVLSEICIKYTNADYTNDPTA